MNERRKDKRANVDLPITVKVGKRQLSGATVNVSFHGLCVKLDETPPLRQLVNIDLNLPAGKPFTAHAMVVHGADGIIGLEFFGRTSHPEWDDFVQNAIRTGPVTNPNAVAIPTNPKVSVPPLPSASVPPRAPIAQTMASPGLSAPPPRGALQPSIPPTPAATPAATGKPNHPTPPPYHGPERRRAPRIHMQLELRLRTPRSIHTASTVDVSMIGATIAVSDLQAQPGEAVIVNLIQPGTSFSFRRDGVLRRITPSEGPWVLAAVDFAPLEPSREVLFAEFMNTAYAHFNAPAP